MSIKKVKKEKVSPKKEKEVEVEEVNLGKINELIGQIEDVKTCLRICEQYDIHRAGGAQVLLEKLENELANY